MMMIKYDCDQGSRMLIMLAMNNNYDHVKNFFDDYDVGYDF